MLNIGSTNHYRYSISKCDILIPGHETISISKINVTGLTIEKDFDNDILPVFSIRVLLNFLNYYTIIENKATVKFKIKFEKYEVDPISPDEENRYKDMVFDSLFSIYINDDSKFLDKKLYEEVRDNVGVNEDMHLTEHEFYLFKEDDIKSSNTIINKVIKSGTMTDITTYMMSTSGVKKLLMSPMDNSKTYNEVLLPPLPMWQSLTYLEQQYGFYKYGSTLFFDFDKVFFIDKNDQCTAYENGEITDVVIVCLQSGNAQDQLPGTYKDLDNNIYKMTVYRQSLEIISASIQTDVLSSTNTTIIPADKDSKINIHPDVETRIGKTKYVVDNFNNEYIHSMIEYSKKENDRIIRASMSDVDIDSLTPNKRFKFVFEDKEINSTHGGYYRLTGIIYTFERMDDGNFAINSIGEFKKA